MGWLLFNIKLEVTCSLVLAARGMLLLATLIRPEMLPAHEGGLRSAPANTPEGQYQSPEQQNVESSARGSGDVGEWRGWTRLGGQWRREGQRRGGQRIHASDHGGLPPLLV
jgi:hypothetical protein